MSTVTATPTSVADVLRAAAEAYRTGAITWGKEFFSRDDDDFCRCTMGAITYAIDPANTDGDPAFIGPRGDPGRALALAAIRAVESVIADRTGQPSGDYVDVGEWNDEAAASVDEVIDVLTAAAVRAERVSA